MSTSNNFGASFGLDTSDLKAGLAKANRLIREAETQFQQAAASVDDWTKSEELLIKKQQTLNKQIELQEAKVNALVREKDNLIKRLKQEGKSDDEISKATDTLNKQIITQTKQLQKMQGDLTKTNKLLDEWQDTSESLIKTQKNLTEQINAQSKKVDDLRAHKEELISTLKDEAAAQEQAQKSFDEVNYQIDEQSNKLAELESQKQSLIAKLKEEGNTNQSTKTSLDEVNAKIDEQAKKIDELTTKKKQLAQELDEEVKKHQNVQKAITSVSEEIETEDKKLSDLRTQLTQTNKKLQDFQDEQQDSVSALDRLTNEINDQEAELKDLQKRYQDVVLEQGESSDAAQQLASRIGTLNNALGMNKSKLKDAQTAMNRMMDDTSDNVVQVVRLREKIVSQRDELDRLKKAYEESVEQTGKNSKSSRELKKEIDNLTVSLGKNEEAYAKMTRVMELAEEMAKQKEVVIGLRKEYNQTGQQIGDLNLEIDHLGGYLAQLGQDMDDGIGDAEQLRKEYKETCDTIDDFKKQLQELEQAHSETGKKLKDAKKAYQDLSDEQKDNIKTAKDLVKSADEAEKAQEDLGKAAKESAEGFTVAKGAIATFIGNGLTKLVDAASNAISSLWNMGEATKEYRTELAKIENIADDVGASTDYIGDKWRDMSSVLGDENAVGEGLNNLMIAGFTAEEQMDEITSYLEGAALKWKDTLKFEGLSDGLQETLATGAAVGQFGEMLERSGINLDDFNAGLAQCTTDAQKQNYVLDELSKLGLAEVSEAYREENKNLIESNKSQKDYQNTLSKFGEIIEPITTKVRNGFATILEKILELASNGDIDAFAQKIDKAFGDFVDKTLPKIISGVEWIFKNGHKIIDVIASIAGALAAAKIVGTITKIIGVIAKVTSGLKAAGGILAVAKTAIAALGGPITLIAAAATAALILIIRHWDDIKAAASAAWKWITETWGKAGEWFKTNVIQPISNFFSGLWQGISDGVSAAWQWIKDTFSSVVTWINDNLIQPLKEFFAPIVEWFGKLFSSIWESYVSYIQNLIGLAQGCWEIIKAVWAVVSEWFNVNIIQPISNFFANMWNGIKNAASDAWSWISGIWQTVSEWFNTNVTQPIKDKFSDIWKSVKEGAKNAWEGIKEVFGKVADWFGNIFSSAWQKVKNVFSSAGEIFDGIKEGIVSAFTNIVNAIIGGINKVIAKPFNAINDALAKIRDIEILGITPFKGKIGQVKVPEIPLLANGGIVRGATQAVIGERGPEGVFPLSGPQADAWMDKLASKLASKQGSGVTVNQTNNYSQAHSRYELYKTKQDTAAAVRLALATV